MYNPEIRLWELFVDDQTSINFAPATRDILVSLRPSYLEGFKVKLGLREMLGLQLHQGPVTSKRPAVEELVSPRSTKLPRHLDPPRLGFSSPSTTRSTAPRPDFNFEDETPTPPSLIPLSQPQVALPLPDTAPVVPDLVRFQKRNENGFPGFWLAHIMLEKTSKYMVERSGKRGSYRTIFKQVYGLDYFPETTASGLPTLYPAAYHHFRSLDHGEQSTIIWIKLLRRFGITRKSSDGMPFIPFTRPVPPPSERSTLRLKQISLPRSPRDQTLQSSSSSKMHAPRSFPGDAPRLDNDSSHSHSSSGLRGAQYVPCEKHLVRPIDPRMIHYSRVLISRTRLGIRFFSGI